MSDDEESHWRIIGMDFNSFLDVNSDSEEIAEVAISGHTETDSHFLTHIERAKEALKLLEYI